MKKQYILFDFDGVIVNTEPQNAHYLQETLKSFGVYIDHEELKGFIGVNSREKILHYLSRSKENVSWEMYQKRRKEMGNTYENDAICPMPGLQELFQWMKGRNLKAGLVTSTSAKYIITALNRIKMTDYFSVIVCGDMCEKRKPYPDGYLKAIQLLQAEKDEVVAIEDSSTGIHAAIQAGIDVIGYTGSGIKQDTGEATAVFSSFQDIQHFLETAIL